MQLADVNFDKKKQKVLWPLYARKEVKSNELPDFLTSEAAQIRKNRKIGFEYSKFKGLESVSGINRRRVIQSKGVMRDREQSETESNSDDEWKKAPFFENSEYWAVRLSVASENKNFQ